MTQLLSNRSQPDFDREPVAGATIAHLDDDLVTAYLAHVRRRSPIFRSVEREQLLVQLGVLTTADDDVVRPTLAGLLCLGQYPQESSRSCSCRSWCCRRSAWARRHRTVAGSWTTTR